MGLYARAIFPSLCDWVLDRPDVARHRRELLASVRGEVLEIGFGTGLNLHCYPDAIGRLTVIDRNPGMHRRARRRLEKSGRHVDQRIGAVESLPFPAENFDCVVSTFTLCSVDRVAVCLEEITRVLRPGGRFFFLEHGLSPDPAVQKWQRRLNPLERWLADGCQLDRNIRTLLEPAGFAGIDCSEHDLERVPPTHGHLYRGTATK
jgi:SAM-dependent methyltransferase